MAFNPGGNATFVLGGTDISAYVTSVSMNIERDIKDVKPIGGNPAVKLPGPYSGTISLEGAYDPVLDAVLAPLMLATTPATSTFAHAPAGAGGLTLAGDAYVASYRVDTPGDDTATWRSELAVSGTITNS
jgi:hypothetical protein